MVAWNPTAQLIFNAVFLGLSAGIFEEGPRYLVLRWWRRRPVPGARVFCSGPGMAEQKPIIFGALALYGFLPTPRPVPECRPIQTLPGEPSLPWAQQQVHAYWSMTWYISMLGALERFFTHSMPDCQWL